MQNEKTKITYERIHTMGTNTTSGDDNAIVFQFQAIMVDVGEITTGSNYYITGGMEYGSETYIWVGQQEITAAIVARVRVVPWAWLPKGVDLGA